MGWSKSKGMKAGASAKAEMRELALRGMEAEEGVTVAAKEDQGEAKVAGGRCCSSQCSRTAARHSARS